MRIIVLNDHGFINGGAAQVAIAGLNGLARAGFEVTFVFGVGPVDDAVDQSLIRTIDLGFYDLLSDPSRTHAAVQGIWNARAASRLRHILSDFDTRDTIIHLHTWTKSLSSSVVRVASELGFKIICTLHDYFAVCPNGGLYNYQRRKACDLEPMSFACFASHCDARSYPQKIWRVARQAVQNNLGEMPRGVHRFITVSGYSESLIRKHLKSDAQFFRVRNPIDIERVAPALVSNHDAFTFVGRLSPEKGAALFSAAAKMAGVRAVFVGRGQEDKNILEANASAELLGWQSREAVIRAIQSSRAVVFPSLWHETQGMVVNEAAALGVPAIVSDACAARDSVVDGETGLLFKANDADDFAAKLSLLNKDAQMAARMGASACERYWEWPSTLESHIKELSDCYREVLGENGDGK